MKLQKIIFLFTLVILFSNLCAQPVEKNLWKAYNFLIGTWEGEGNGQPGQGTGTVIFAYSLDNKIIIRKNHNEYPATSDRPAFVHDDLAIYYVENGSSRTDYYDNEGHVIHYSNSFSADSASLVMVSDINQGTPRYRFTYTKLEPSKMKVTFEFAPPGKPEEFKKYVEGTVRKKDLIFMANLKYHHLGIPTKEKRADETFIEKFQMSVSGYDTSQYKIEWMRFEKDAPFPEIVKTIPHVAFEVDNLEEAIKGKDILIKPNSPTPGVMVAFVLDNGAPVELLEIDRSIAKEY